MPSYILETLIFSPDRDAGVSSPVITPFSICGCRSYVWPVLCERDGIHTYFDGRTTHAKLFQVPGIC